VLFVISFALSWGDMMQAFNNPENFQRMSGMGFGRTGIQLVVSLLGILIRLGSLVWMILELSDRRGNWLWLLPYLLCCCCGFDWLILAIYMLAGRQK